MKMSPKIGSESQKEPIGIQNHLLNILVTLERGHLSWFWYPTHNIGTYLGRGGGGVNAYGQPGRKISVFLTTSLRRDVKKADILWSC